MGANPPAPTSDGYSVVVVSDVTTNKKAELALFGMTEQLKHLATTDSLTGLLNRRAVDEALERELSRSARERTPISLLLIDVDHFKAFNDYYGHRRATGACALSVNAFGPSYVGQVI